MTMGNEVSFEEMLTELLGSAFDVQVERDESEVTSERITLCLSDGAITTEGGPVEELEDYDHAEELGRQGSWWNSGLLHKDGNARFAPAVARGAQYNHGQLWQWFISNSDFRTGIEDIARSVSMGRWVVEWPEEVEIPEYMTELAELYLREIRRALEMSGAAWRKHVREALLMIPLGYSLFEKVWDPKRRKMKLNFRWPHTVQRWVLDSEERELLGIDFFGVDEVVPYTKHVHYVHGGYGVDPEGLAALRTVGLLIELGQQLMRLYGVAATAFGVPWIFVESDAETADSGNDRDTVKRLNGAKGKERPVFKLKSGHRVVMVSPTGQIPDVLGMLKYLDEKITKILKSEGSLIGFQSVGTYSVQDAKDSGQTDAALVWGTILAEELTAQLVPDVCMLRFGAPLLPHTFPRIRYDLGLADERISVQDLVALIEKGVIKVTPELQQQVHEWYGLDLPEDLKGA